VVVGEPHPLRPGGARPLNRRRRLAATELIRSRLA